MVVISLGTPTLLFSAISLLFLAYTNRFLSIAKVIRTIHHNYPTHKNKNILKKQLENLHRRVMMIRNMQLFGVLSFSTCILSMIFLFFENTQVALVFFGISLLLMLTSLIVALQEIYISVEALNYELQDLALEKNLVIPRLIKTTKRLLNIK